MKIIRNIIIFSMLASLTITYSQGGKQKTVKVEGQVIDSEGFPIHKAYVFADSLKTGFRTNKKGVFKLRVPTDTDILSIYSEKHGMKSEVYNGQEKLDFTFTKNNEPVTEQQLTNSGYILDVEVFQNIGKKSYAEYQNIFQIIQEKFTGVIVDRGGIFVRGYIGGDQTPLFVVDGNYVNSIGGINPDELKSIELLKGEEAALYGARGAPGVFIINLK